MKKFLCVILSIVLGFTLPGCYFQDADNSEEYSSFLQEIEEKNDTIYSILPKNDKIDFVQDVYLYYSDFDMIDSLYSIYVNCIYEQDTYVEETQRVLEVTNQWEFVKENVDSFDYNSIVINQYLDFDDSQIGMMDYSYVLFDDNDYRIVYVFILEKELNGMSMNIPNEYLPKEVVSLREGV